MNPHDLDHTIVTYINDKNRDLENIILSDVIGYFGQIHPAYFRRFRNFIEEIKSKSTRSENSLSIVLRTTGGSAEVVERLVGVIRHHYDNLNLIVPDIAMSAGTIFCMAGDRIYMDYSSSLGPIDPQVMLPDGSGYVAALGYLDKVREITNKRRLSPADAVFLRGLDLARLALYEQARDLSIDLLKQWLVQYKFKNWTVHRTTKPGAKVTAKEKETRAEEIATALSDNKRWHSHGRALDVDKLKTLRLEIDDYSGDQRLQGAIRSFNDLLTGYMDRMELTFHLHSHHVEVI